MWSYLALYWVLYFGYPPFHVGFMNGVMSDIINVLGPLHEEWKGICSHPGSLNPGMTRIRILNIVDLQEQLRAVVQMQIQMSETLCSPLC